MNYGIYIYIIGIIIYNVIVLYNRRFENEYINDFVQDN